MEKSICKEEINRLPIVKYAGEIVIVDNTTTFQEAIKEISRYKVVGFDTETRPSFKKGVSYNVSLLQLATSKKVYLFRLKKLKDLQPLMDILNDPKILKIGLSVKDDWSMLRKCHPLLEPQSFVELQTYVKQFDIMDNSLQKIYAIVFKQKISKSERLSNWEAETLAPKQQIYAATDAWACLQLWNRLEKRRKRKITYQKNKAKKAITMMTEQNENTNN